MKKAAPKRTGPPTVHLPLGQAREAHYPYADRKMSGIVVISSYDGVYVAVRAERGPGYEHNMMQVNVQALMEACAERVDLRAVMLKALADQAQADVPQISVEFIDN
jgi:hypothetical protein